MTRKRTLSAALATTASVALLAGLSPAQAQMAGAPGGPCSTTLESPAFNNCTLPSSSAPGAGSFPGSFLVPGTSTSFAVHGILWVQAYHDFGPSAASGGLLNAGALQGPGITATGLGEHALNGNTDMTVGPTRPNIETRTPTAYGELKTYIELDFNMGTNASSTVYGGSGGAVIPSSGSSQLAGNMDFVRLRQAYATLGPWLMGQTKTLVDDVQAYPDLADAGLDVGMRVSTIVHKPQIRYTYLAGNGVSLAVSLEQPTHESTAAAYYAPGSTGAATALAATTYTEDNNGLIPGTSIVSIPDVGASVQWDQPWGHLRFTGMYHDSKVDMIGCGNSTTAPASSTTYTCTQSNPFTPNSATTGQNGFRNENAGYWIGLSGHLNTWGKDRLTGNFAYDSGFSDAVGTSPYDFILANGGVREAVTSWNLQAAYEHFFTSQWRANVSGGYLKFTEAGLPGNPGVNPYTGANPNPTPGAGFTAMETTMPTYAYTAHANVIFSPVPQTDFITEYSHETYHTYAGDRAREDRVMQQFKFYF